MDDLRLDLLTRHASTAETPLPQIPETSAASPERQDVGQEADFGPRLVLSLPQANRTPHMS